MNDEKSDKVVLAGFFVVGLYDGHSQFIAPYVLKTWDQQDGATTELNFEPPDPIDWKVPNFNFRSTYDFVLD